MKARVVSRRDRNNLIRSVSSVDGARPEARKTRHLGLSDGTRMLGKGVRAEGGPSWKRRLHLHAPSAAPRASGLHEEWQLRRRPARLARRLRPGSCAGWGRATDADEEWRRQGSVPPEGHSGCTANIALLADSSATRPRPCSGPEPEEGEWNSLPVWGDGRRWQPGERGGDDKGSIR